MIIKMELLSDAIFGNGVSVPGEEDISVLCDIDGFPYFKGGTLKGLFREALTRLLKWKNLDSDVVDQLMGKEDDIIQDSNKLSFSDLTISDDIKQSVLEELGDNPETIKRLFTHTRTFTALDEGMIKKGSLRTARCVNKGLCLYGRIDGADDNKLVKEAIRLIRQVGTMRNRGFGDVVIEEVKNV